MTAVAAARRLAMPRRIAYARAILRRVDCVPQRVALTPYDRLFLASHQLMRERRLPGHPIVLRIDVAGPLDPDRLARSAAAALRRHRLLLARLRFTRLLARAYWLAADADPDHAAAPVVAFHDLRAAADPAAVEAALVAAALDDLADGDRPPHLRILLFRVDDARHRVAFCYPHYLMDLAGGEQFIRDCAVDADPGAPPVPLAPVPPDGYPRDWSSRRIRATARGLVGLFGLARHSAARIRTNGQPATIQPLMLHRTFDPAAVERVRDASRQFTAPGPARHTRWFAQGVVRALEALAAEFGFAADHFLISLPLGRPNREERPVATRNDFTIVNLVVPRRLIAQPDELDRVLADQISRHLDSGGEAAWNALAFAGLLRGRHYRWMLRHNLGIPPLSVGFASYRHELDRATFLGQPVEMLRAAGLPPIPPGLMLTFSAGARSLCIGLATYSHLCPAERGERLLAHIAAALTTAPDGATR